MRLAAAAAVALAACAPAPGKLPVAALPRPPRPPAPVTLPNGEPILRLPFPEGTVVLCQQGNRTAKPRSHAWPNTLHALDLSAPGAQRVPIVAAAGGVVRRVVTGGKAGEKLPGWGFGSHVVVEHEGGWSTLYAHLADVQVTEKQRVAVGERLGTMGDTGLAGNVHLHFSLHRAAFPDGAPETVPIHALVAADVSKGAGFELLGSLELVCADAEVSPAGHLYASENGGGAARFGPVPPLLGVRVAAQKAARVEGVRAARPELERVLAGLAEAGPKRTREALEALVAKDPKAAPALYWIAVLSLRDLGDWERARSALASLEATGTDGHPWLAPWLRVRKAELAEHDKKLDEARRLTREARGVKGQGDEYDRFVAELAKRLGVKE